MRRIETATRRPPHPGGRQLNRLRWTYWEWNFGSKLGFLRNWKSNGFGTFFDFPCFFFRVRFLIDCEIKFEYIWFKNRYQVEVGSRRSISGDFLRFWKQSKTESYMYFIFCQQNLKSMEFSRANLSISFLKQSIFPQNYQNKPSFFYCFVVTLEQPSKVPCIVDRSRPKAPKCCI